jgi:hypothetical protein
MSIRIIAWITTGSEYVLIQSSGDTYLRCSNIMRRFPTLEMLDKEPVTKISFDAPRTPHPVGPSGSHSIAKDFPLPIQPPLIAGVDGSLITSFLARYVSILPFGRVFFTIRSGFSRCSIHNEPRCQMSTMNLPHSRSKPIPPSLPVPKSKDSNTQRKCQINAT